MNVAAATGQMNRIYRRQRHIYDFTRRYYLLGRDELIERLGVLPGHRVLEMGCGTGRNLIVAANRYPEARFYGVDVSTEMLTSAREAIGSAAQSSRIRVEHGDASAFEPRATFGIERFDRVFVAYTLSMVPEWQAAIDRALSLLAPGGELHVVDFGGQTAWPGLARLALRRWLSAFHVTPREELENALTMHAIERGARLVFERRFGDYVQYGRMILPAT
jgi:S-adenosylmethionine-diacylgycerolhomoserine-N-methlytransferase